MENQNTNSTPVQKKFFMNQNEVCICGRIGSVQIRDVVTKNGKTVQIADMSVATHNKVVGGYSNGRPIYKTDENGKTVYEDAPVWHKVTAFSGQFTTRFENLKVGALVNLRGRLKSESYTVTNSDNSPVLKDGKPLQAVKTYILVSGEYGSLGIVNPVKPAVVSAPAASSPYANDTDFDDDRF